MEIATNGLIDTAGASHIHAMKSTVILVPAVQPFSFAECLKFLDRQLDDCLHVIDGAAVRKVLTIGERMVLVELTGNDDGIHVRILDDGGDPIKQDDVNDHIREMFDIDRDIMPFYDILADSDELAYMPHAFCGLRMIGIPDLFEALCWSIIGQQINLAFAHRIKRRLVTDYGSSMSCDGTLHYVFPRADILADARPEDLRAMQLSRSKVDYIIGIARTITEGRMSREILRRMDGVADRRRALMELNGVGPWTANYVLMKTMREPSSIPHGDAGMIKALVDLGMITDRKDTASIARFFDRFPGWESYASFYLWRSLYE